MGASCCCLRNDYEDFANPNNAIYRNCVCLHCFVRNFLHVYGTLSRRGEDIALSSSAQGTASIYPMVSLDNSLIDMYRSPPRPLPYNADPRYIHLQQHDGLIMRREKGSSHLHDETEPLRPSEVDEESENLSNKNKWNQFEESKEYNSKSSPKLSTTTGFDHFYTISEDEDACPTCLEEYNTENPKIITKCNHHYHLSCIYEWMERSDTCPVCGKVMAFDEPS